MAERDMLDSEAHERIAYLRSQRDAALLVERALGMFDATEPLSLDGKVLAVKANPSAHEKVSGVVTAGVVYDLAIALLYATTTFTRKGT